MSIQICTSLGPRPKNKLHLPFQQLVGHSTKLSLKNWEQRATSTSHKKLSEPELYLLPLFSLGMCYFGSFVLKEDSKPTVSPHLPIYSTLVFHMHPKKKKKKFIILHNFGECLQQEIFSPNSLGSESNIG